MTLYSVNAQIVIRRQQQTPVQIIKNMINVKIHEAIFFISLFTLLVGLKQWKNCKLI